MAAHGVEEGTSEAVSHQTRPDTSSASATYSQRDGNIMSLQDSEYDVPDDFANLDEVAVSGPAQTDTVRLDNLEAVRSARQVYPRVEETHETGTDGTALEVAKPVEGNGNLAVSRQLTHLYTVSYLILFAILGTLARLGLSALTYYPGAPITFSVLWPNFGGSLIMGFLIEDRQLFNTCPRHAISAPKRTDEERSSSVAADTAEVQTRSEHLAFKKTTPLYIGLATGFCGSFTSFSSFILDAFLGVSNDLPTPGTLSSTERNGGYSFMALLAVVLVTVCVSLSALFAGGHLALATQRVVPSLRYAQSRRVLDPLVVLLGWGSWIGAVFLAIFPPYDLWRGRVVFALVFAPLGCLARFYLALHLNGTMSTFPLGTFFANVAGTAVLGMSWDIAHVPIGGVVGCQVLQGVQDGFCGCLTTVSTWVAELSSLRRVHAYVYGGASVAAAFVLMVAIMGGLRWTGGFSPLLCST